MKYSIGLDIGITSIGWAVVEIGDDGRDKRIERLGVRLFDEAENPKDGKSLAEPRRLARSARRRLRRRRGRLDALIQIFIKHKLLTREEIRVAQQTPQNPVEVRARGLDKKLSPTGLFVALFHIAKRRGYQSNRKKIEAADKETGALLGSANANHERLAKYRTVGEMLAKDTFFAKATRNKKEVSDEKKTGATSSGYKCTVLRDDLRKEVQVLFARQRELGLTLLEDFEKDITKAIFYQRPFAKAGDVEEKVGKCEFLKDERRAAKSSYTYELSRLYQSLNHVSIIDEVGNKYPLVPEERGTIVALAHEQVGITYKSIRKALNVPRDNKFVGLLYKGDKDPETAGKNKFSLTSFHEIKKHVESVNKGEWKALRSDVNRLNAIAEVLTLYKTDQDIFEQLHKLGLSEAVCEALSGVSFSGFGNLSLVALKRLQSHLEIGQSYVEACDAEGFKPGKMATRGTYLQGLDKNDHTLTNPVMKRAVSQTIKVINAIVREYGAPYFVKIECAHDLSRDQQERKKIQKRQDENRTANEQLLEQAKELGVADPKGFDILKLRLYREQQGKCAYTLAPLDERRVFSDAEYAEVDHIIPYSRSGDDRNLNKVLVISGANRDKLNRTPYEWFGADEERWRTFAAYVQSCAKMHPRKQELLTTKKYAPSEDWKSRALNDTRYITRFLSGYIDDGLEFAAGKEKRRVIISNGSMTAYLRRRWRIEKDRESGHLHHAADAAVIASINPLLIQRIAQFSKASEIRPYLRAQSALQASETIEPDAITLAQEMIASHESRASDFFPKPWEKFDDELREKVKDVFVSYAPKRKVSGQAHKETRQSPKEHDKSGFFINDGKTFVSNGSMLCVDIFEKEVKGKKRYFVVPIYVHQTVQKDLPSQVLPKTAGFSDIDDSFSFSFRIFPRDLIKLTYADGGSDFLYYRKYGTSVGQFTLDTIEGGEVSKNISTLPLVKKCVVDPLGKVSIVHKETRLDFYQGKR